MSTIVRDLARSRVLVPAYDAPPTLKAECSHCGANIDILEEHVSAVPEGVEINAVCVECIPDYLKG